MIMRKNDNVLKKIEELRKKIDSEFPPETNKQNQDVDNVISSYLKSIKTPSKDD